MFTLLGTFKGRVDFAITPELEKELSCDTPIPQRLRAIRELGENLHGNRLEDVSSTMLYFSCRNVKVIVVI